MKPSERYGRDPEFAALVDRAAAQAGDTASEVLRGLDELVVHMRPPTGIAALAELLGENAIRRRPPTPTARPSVPPWARQKVRR